MTAEQRNRAGMDDVEEIDCNVIQFLSKAVKSPGKLGSNASSVVLFHPSHHWYNMNPDMIGILSYNQHSSIHTVLMHLQSSL